MGNQSVSEIILLGFQDLRSFRIILFFACLGCCLASIVANLLILILVSSTLHLLYSPMYIFLSYLSVIDIMITTSVSSTLISVTWDTSVSLPLAGCITQFFIFGSCTTIECFLLTVMSYDRYLAICKPLHYVNMMTSTFCHQLAICSWVLGGTMTSILVIMISNLIFCGPNTIDHFFCDLAPLLDLSCSDTKVVQIVLILFGAPETFIESVFIISTYVCIFLSILRIPSATGRHKTFSTCSSHLAVVSSYYGTLFAIYITPTGNHQSKINMFLSLLCTVITPLFNPLIYSLRNYEIQMALKKFLNKHPNNI